MIRNPHRPRPQGEWIGGEIVRQFWERAIPHASAQSQKRFILALDEYVGSMVPEANDRSERRIRNIQDYTDMRRKTIGAMPISALYQLGLDIPGKVIAHQTIQDMETAHTDILSIFNDMVSYNVEQSRGQAGHNIVTIVMHELNMDVNGAM
ncbi:terpenoid synthase, partial [Rhizopogon salebrosus TDB-379]